MSSSVLIIPTFSRAEFLWLCLDHVAQCIGIDEIAIQVVVDAHVGKPMPPLQDIKVVIRQFPQLDLTVTTRTPHSYSGNSYNVLQAYRDAYESRAKYVFMVEDDVMVSPTFLQWHVRQQEKFNPAVSIGVSAKGFKEYASLGVCFRRQELGPIVKHFCQAYLQDMRGYCKRVFPSSPLEVEQDGLICRVLRGKKRIWAEPPVAQHVGWYGYHRPKSYRPKGTIEQRYWQVKKILKDPARLAACIKEQYHDVAVLKTLCN